jgi:hypothetical protein
LAPGRLHGSKPEAALWVTFDDELDGPSTKITDAVKEYDRVVFHFLFGLKDESTNFFLTKREK